MISDLLRGIKLIEFPRSWGTLEVC